MNRRRMNEWQTVVVQGIVVVSVGHSDRDTMEILKYLDENWPMMKFLKEIVLGWILHFLCLRLNGRRHTIRHEKSGDGTLKKLA